MEILSVALKNFKSHRDRQFVFEPGMNAICGENGAGKTSILEAIAWALFNHRGAYTTEDLIRNGAASAQVMVEFISNRDSRTYRIQRCTRTGYTIYDPQLGQKLDYSRIDDEVMPWLCDQFGMPRGTDLGRLFASTIGVPQGTFTVDFLKTDRERREIFDRILKLEEYRQAYQQLATLEKYGKAEIERLEREIAHYDQTLQGFEELQRRHQVQAAELHQAQAELQQLEATLQQQRQELEQLTQQAAQVQQIAAQIERLQTQIDTQTIFLQQQQADLHQAEQAVAICTRQREAFQAYQQAEQVLTELEQHRQQERLLHQQLSQKQHHLAQLEAQLAALNSQQTRLEQTQTTIAHLTAQIPQQEAQEAAFREVEQQLQAIASLRQTLESQTNNLAQKQAQLTRLEEKISQIQILAPWVERIPTLEQQQQRLHQQLSRIAAAQQFETELRQLVQQATLTGEQQQAAIRQAILTLQQMQAAAPMWQSALASIQSTLEQGAHWQTQVLHAIQMILADLSQQTQPAQLEQQLQQINLELQTARQYQADFANLDWLQTQRQEQAAVIAQIQASLPQMEAQVAAQPALEHQQQILRQQLEALNDPRGQCRLLQQELEQAIHLPVEIAALQTRLATEQSAISHIKTQLNAFANLEQQVQAQQAIRQAHQAAYQQYLAYRELANTCKAKQQQVQETQEQLATWQTQIQTLTTDRDCLQASFDPIQLQTLQLEYQQASDRAIALKARLPDLEKLLQELHQQLVKLTELQTQRQGAEEQLKLKQKTARFIKFARDSYKKAGPRITERYVQRISWEADRLFRELLNRPNVSLEWTRDYEILVREAAHTRRFVNLSGGEQMCAALAVRLALLKVLADLDVAFFDEPTTNMDRPRRRHLAEAIGNIKTFRQLFVISHDDTFENLTGNIITVQREA